MRRVALIWGCAVLLAACASPLPKQPQPPPDEGDWPGVRERATRSGKLYDGLATNAFASAVYQSPQVREARVNRVATWRATTPQEREALLTQEREDAARYEEFLISLFTPNPSDNDLDAARSVWRVALVLPGEVQLVPDSIRLIRVDSLLRTLYPTIGHFDSVYVVRFAKRDPPGPPFVLRLAGAKGRLDLSY